MMDAVNVTELPASDGSCEDAMLTDGSAFTVSVIVEDVAVFPGLTP